MWCRDFGANSGEVSRLEHCCRQVNIKYPFTTQKVALIIVTCMTAKTFVESLYPYTTARDCIFSYYI